MTILDEIVETKRTQVAEAKRRRPLADVQAGAAAAPPPRDFHAAITNPSRGGVNMIAEVKRASPSAGLIVQDFDPVAIARTYAACGASAISVLTDETYFQGHLRHIAQIKAAVSVPILRKDFMLEEYQIFESREAGADAVLLIAEVLGAKRIADLLTVARDLNLSTLVEVHSADQLNDVIKHVGLPSEQGYLLGINNRDLHAQRTDVATTARLASVLPKATPFVSESGLHTRDDVLTVERAGACAVLIGQALLKAGDIRGKISELLGR